MNKKKSFWLPMLAATALTPAPTLFGDDLPFTLGWEVIEDQPQRIWTMLTLDDGTVFCAVYKSNDIYILDPEANTWTQKTSSTGMVVANRPAQDKLLNDGRVFRMTGGYIDDPVRASIYDPETDSWTTTAHPRKKFESLQ